MFYNKESLYAHWNLSAPYFERFNLHQKIYLFQKNRTSIALNHRVGLYIYGLYLEMVAPIVK